MLIYFRADDSTYERPMGCGIHMTEYVVFINPDAHETYLQFDVPITGAALFRLRRDGFAVQRERVDDGHTTDFSDEPPALVWDGDQLADGGFQAIATGQDGRATVAYLVFDKGGRICSLSDRADDAVDDLFADYPRDGEDDAAYPNASRIAAIAAAIPTDT